MIPKVSSPDCDTKHTSLPPYLLPYCTTSNQKSTEAFNRIWSGITGYSGRGLMTSTASSIPSIYGSTVST